MWVTNNLIGFNENNKHILKIKEVITTLKKL